MTATVTPPVESRVPAAVEPGFWVRFGLLTAVGTAAYWDTLTKAADRWATDPQYSHGYLVPAFAAYLLYHRRRQLAGADLTPSAWAAVPLAVAVGLRFAEAVVYLNGLDPLSLVPAFGAVLLASGGRPALKWGWPAAVFGVFMVPLPYRLQTLFSGQLQGLATQVCTFFLVAAGYPALAEGNVIVVNDVRVGVVEACSGLGMVMTFAALSVAFAFLTKSAGWAKVVLLLGALPVAVAANVARICATAVLYDADDNEQHRALAHDAAGWLMIPLGCVLVLIEVWVLDSVLLKGDDPGRRTFRPLLPAGTAGPGVGGLAPPRRSGRRPRR